MENNKIDISLNIILKVLLIILSLGFLYLIRDIIAIFLVAIVIKSALNPIIRKFQDWKISRTYSVILVYFLFFITVISLLSFVVPIFIHQFQEFFKIFPKLINEVVPKSFDISEKLRKFDLEGNLFNSLGGIFDKTLNFVTGVISSLAVVSLSFYMSLEENGLKKSFIALTPKEYKKYMAHVIDEIYSSFGKWMTGLLITMLFVGLLYFVGLSILNIPFAILLALIGGLLEIIPYFGPIVAGIPAIILGFSQSPLIGVSVLVIYWLINLIENNILVPKIMNKAVGLSPVIVMLALLVGGKLGGMLGLFLAVPLAGAVNVLAKDFLNNREKIN